MRKILKRILILFMCAAFFASCGTAAKSSKSKENSDKQLVKQEKKTAKEKKKKGKSKEAKSGDYLVPINEAVAAGNYGEAYALISQDDNKAFLGSEDIYNMDAGMLKIYEGDMSAATKHLEPVANMQKLNDRYNSGEKVVISTFFADEYSQPYVTYDYEDLYAAIFDAMAKLDDPEMAGDAFQDLKNIREMLLAMDQYNKVLSEKLNETGELDKESTDSLPPPANIVFNNSALANYLALIYNKYNDRDGDQRNYFYKEMSSAYEQDSYSYAEKKKPATAEAELDSVPAGKARLNVLALMGLMAEKKGKEIEVSAPIKFLTSKISENPEFKEAKLDPSMITGKLDGLFAGNKYKVVYTELKDQSELANCECTVTINGKNYELEQIENISAIASKCIERKQNMAARRSLIRNVIKSIPLTVAYLVADESLSEISNPIAKKAAEAGVKTAKNNVLKSLTNEYADIRGAHFFPAQVYGGGIELDPGIYDVTITFSNGVTETKSVEVKAGQLNLLQVRCQK